MENTNITKPTQNIYSCKFPNCRRRFNSQLMLKHHQQRRHNQQQFFKGKITKKFKLKLPIKPMMNQKMIFKLQNSRQGKRLINQANRKIIKLKRQQQKPLLKNPSSKITLNYILQKSSTNEISEVTHLALGDEKHQTFQGAVGFKNSDLINLEFLVLSNNQLVNVNGIFQCVNLQELNINYNQISDLSPLFQLKQLTRLFATSNQIQNITGIQELEKLKDLALGQNQINDLEMILEDLASLTKLQTLELSDNPVDTFLLIIKLTSVHKYIPTSMISFGVWIQMSLIMKLSLIMIFSFRKLFMRKRKIILVFQVLQQQPLKVEDQSSKNIMMQSMINFRPQTAVNTGKGSRSKRSYKDRFKQKIFKDNFQDENLEEIPETINHEKLAELENQQEQLIYQKDFLYDKLDHATEQNDTLDRQYKELLTKNKQLKKMYDESEDALIQNELFKENLQKRKKNSVQTELANKIKAIKAKIKVLQEKEQKKSKMNPLDYNHRQILQTKQDQRKQRLQGLNPNKMLLIPTKQIKQIRQQQLQKKKSPKKFNTKLKPQIKFGKQLFPQKPENQEISDANVMEMLMRNSSTLLNMKDELKDLRQMSESFYFESEKEQDD